MINLPLLIGTVRQLSKHIVHYVLCLLIAGLFAYSCWIWWISPSSSAVLSIPLSDSPTRTLQSLLFRREDKLILFQTAPNKKPFTTPGGAQPQLARFFSPTRLIASTATGARIFDIGLKRNYEVFRQENTRLAAATTNEETLFSTRERTGRSVLAVYSKYCQEPLELPLVLRPQNIQRQLLQRALPAMHTMLASPFATTLVVLDHAFSPRISIVNLVNNTSQELVAPFFGTQQIHFSPLFVDERTLLFSVIDGNRWGTVLYSIPDGRAQLFSDNFTDRAFLSTSRDLILLQSFYDNGQTNIPFGSRTLYASTKSPDAKQGEGSLQILRGTFKNGFSVVHTLPFQTDVNSPYFEFRQNIDPLLAAMGFSPAVIKQYREQVKSADAAKENYEFIDAF